jgi:hypothetical protein
MACGDSTDGADGKVEVCKVAKVAKSNARRADSHEVDQLISVIQLEIFVPIFRL